MVRRERGGLVALLMSLQVEAGSEEVLVVEVDRSEVSGDLVLASEPGKVAARAQVTLEDALARLKPSLGKVVDLLKDLSPNQTVVEFGLKLGGETGAIIAKGTAEVNFKVTMSWGDQ
jgi:Trypsin-co-occurring domain 1